jgi:cell division protease FtsH
MSDRAAGGGETPAQPKTDKPDIADRRNRRPARLWGRVFVFLLLAALALLAFAAWRNPSILNTMLPALVFVAQIIAFLFAAAILYVGLVWTLSRSRVEVIRPGDPGTITLSDYWGQPRLSRLAKQWIALLSDQERFVQMGGQPIAGILLYGPPGTGKTMLVKAMAGEAALPLISVSGSSFQAAPYLLDALKMLWFIRRAKNLAREYGACLAHLDEIDALGPNRNSAAAGRGSALGNLFGGGGAGALARLLYEMDGVEELRGKPAPARRGRVLYIASTTRPDWLDPALLRRGRFDQRIRVGVPDRAGRREIVNGYLSKVQHDDTVNPEAIVEDTAGAAPADIAAALTRNAVRLALFNGRDRISQRDVDQALEEQAVGIEHPIEEWDPEQRRQVAYHEAGHAVAQHYLMPDQRIVRVTIVRRGGVLGYMRPVDRVEVYAEPLRRIAADIMVAMAGHVATRLFMGELWTGASADFNKIRNEIWNLYSLGYFGVHDIDNKVRGAPTNADPLIERFWRTLDEQTERLLRDHAEEVEAIARALLEKSELSHEAVMALLGDNGWPRDQSKTIRPPREAPRPAPAPLPVPAPAGDPLAASQGPPASEGAASGEDDHRPPARMLPPPRPGNFTRAAPPPAEAESESRPDKA